MALIVTAPLATPLAMPPATVATVESELLHCTELDKSFVLPSEYLPVAVNCWFPPGVIDAEPGVTAIEAKVGVGALPVPVVPPVPDELPEELPEEPPEPLVLADFPAPEQPTSAPIRTKIRTKFRVFTLVSTGEIPDFAKIF